jgi:hypothetical protein
MPYAPEQNGAAELEIRTIVGSAHQMLHASGLLKVLSSEACNTAVCILEPYWTYAREIQHAFETAGFIIGKLWSISCFGTECYVHIPKHKRHKRDTKSRLG